VDSYPNLILIAIINLVITLTVYWFVHLIMSFYIFLTTRFYFEPNADRTGIDLEDDPLLNDLVADNDDEMSAVTIGTGFAGITDIETGPDGNLYILTFDRGAEGQGSLYRIMPTAEGDTTTNAGNAVSTPTPPPSASPQDVDNENEVDNEEQDDQDENDDNSGDE
jgi:hypothetical protein